MFGLGLGLANLQTFELGLTLGLDLLSAGNSLDKVDWRLIHNESKVNFVHLFEINLQT